MVKEKTRYLVSPSLTVAMALPLATLVAVTPTLYTYTHIHKRLGTFAVRLLLLFGAVSINCDCSMFSMLALAIHICSFGRNICTTYVAVVCVYVCGSLARSLYMGMVYGCVYMCTDACMSGGGG